MSGAESMRPGRAVGRSACAAGLLLAAVVLILLALPVEAQQAASKEPTYRPFPLLGSRLAVWVVAQIHLNFAAFILGVPIFAVIIEIIGWRIGTDGEAARYDWLSHELVKLTFAAFSTTALLGALLLFLLVALLPEVLGVHERRSSSRPMWLYAAAVLRRDLHRVPLVLRLELAHRGRGRGSTSAIGVLSNLLGTAILFVAELLGHLHDLAGRHRRRPARSRATLWAAINNFTWMPINIHRLIANVVFGGTIAGAYAAFRFLARQDRRGARPLRLDGLHRQFRRAVGASSSCRSPATGSGREIYALQPDDGHHDDGRLHVVAVDHPGHPHRRSCSSARTTTSGSAWSASPAPSAIASTCRRCW